MNIKKLKQEEEYFYPITGTAAVYDDNFQNEDGTTMTQEEINNKLNSRITSIESNYVSTSDNTYAKAEDLTNEINRAKEIEETKLDKTAIDAYAKKVTTSTSAGGFVELQPNTNVDITPMATVNITLAEPTDTSIVNVYMCTISMGGTAYAVTLPEDVHFNEELSFETNTFSVINIRYMSDGYYGMVQKWSK